jgi:ankyrin repeat protein
MASQKAAAVPGNSTATTQQQEAAHVRPTEAQLRWAQFHHKRRAQTVKASYERLWQSPNSVDDVEGAVAEDAASTTDTSDSTVRQIRARRPKISKGRRALLRISQRDHKKRREMIMTEGFQGGAVGDASMDEDDDALDAIFAAPRKRNKKKRRRGDDESFRRFQAACHAMMMNLQAPPEITIDAPERIWKPSEHHMNAAEIEQEYRKHLLKHGMDNGQHEHSLHPMDRGASWMMHLPNKSAPQTQLHPFYTNFTSHGEYPYQYPASSVGAAGDDDNVSQATASTLALRAPGRHKFSQLLAMVQQQVIARTQEETRSLLGAPTVRLKPNPDIGIIDANQTETSDVVHERRSDADGSIDAATKRSPPKMKLRSELNGDKGSPSPRMKLKEFTTAEHNGDGDDLIRRPSDLPDMQRLPPTMRLRESYDGQEAIIGTPSRKVNPFNYSPPTMKLATPIAPNTTTLSKAQNYRNATPRTIARLQGTPSPALRDFTVARSPMYEHDVETPNTKNLRSVNYVPRMKLREFTANDNYEPDEVDEDDIETLESMRDKRQVEDEKKVNDVYDQVQKDDKTSKSNKAISDRFMNMYGQGGKKSVSPVHRTVLPGETNEEGRGAFLAVSPLNPGLPNTNVASNLPSDSDELSPMHPAVPMKKKSNRDKKQKQGSSTKGEDATIQTPNNNIGNSRENSESMSNSKVDNANEDEPRLSGFWAKGRTSLQAAIDSTLNSIPQSERDSSGQPMPTPANLKTRVDNANDRVSSFFNKLRGQQAGQEEQAEFDEDDDMIHHLAGFHKTQEKRRESMTPEDSSSVSSFRVLPEGIRSVVKGLYKNPSTPGQESESPSRSPTTRSSLGDPPQEKFEGVHDREIQHSDNIGDFQMEQPIIDTDETTSQASGAGMESRVAASLMMSPTLLNKRLKQAVRAAEKCNWEQVSYLIHANPWLAEMSELTTGQNLLHKVAYYGGGENRCPDKLHLALLNMHPAAIHKFDSDGNLPLHLAAASRNLEMIKVLGERFGSGASVRNEDGMLPLHFAIASFGGVDLGNYGDQASYDDKHPSPLDIIKAVLNFFPKAVAITDNDGNLPIHICAEALEPPFGVDVAFLLLDEADRQINDPYGARFYNRVRVQEFDDDAAAAALRRFEKETDSMVNLDDRVHCNVVRNEFGETPLLTAIRSGNGWEMIEAIASAPGGSQAAIMVDADKNNSLHHLVGPEFGDAAGALSVLKVAPEAASARNSDGMLPIEIACMRDMPHEVIFAIALVDLPIDIEQKTEVKVREGFGDSWWYLACECDDHYVDIVKQVLSMCTFLQIRELCFMKRGFKHSGTPVISLATPGCRHVLTWALRFLGRFEFLGNSPLMSDPSIGLQEFDALDFGERVSTKRPNDEGKRVLLKCFSSEEYFISQVRQSYPLLPMYSLP